MLDLFGDQFDIDRLDLGQIAVENRSTRQQEAVGFFGSHWEIAVGQEVLCTADLAPILVEGGNRKDVGDIDIVDEIHCFLPQVFELGDPVRGEVGGASYAAHCHALEMRVLASEY